MRFIVRDCDPNTGEPDDDGYEDEYVVSNMCSISPCQEGELEREGTTIGLIIK